MTALTLLPPSVWRSPADDAIYSRFDPNLIYASSGGSGSVQIDAGSIEMTAPPTTQPTANFFSTPLQKVRVSMNASILENSGATEPFRIGIWSPWSESGEFIIFGPAPENDIEAESVEHGSLGTTLIGGQTVSYSVLGHYELAKTYHLGFDIDKPGGVITTTVIGDNGTRGEASLTSRDSPKIFGPVQVALTASANPSAGTSRVVLTNYNLILSHQRVWASKVDDPRASWLIAVLSLAGLLGIGIRLFSVVRNAAGRLTNRLDRNLRINPWIVGAVFLYLAGNALLFPTGAHPFDMGDQQLYAYVSRAYGAAQLFFLPNVVSLASVWSGVPYGEFAFPYEAVTAYLSTAIGWLNSIVFAGGGTFPLDSARLEYLIKSINVLFGLADAGLIYLILRTIGTSEKWSVIPAGLFLFNPAVWFNMSVWGQTHVISLFFVLAAIYAAESRLPFWAWLALAAACLTRPQMLVFGLLLGIVFLKKFSWQENLSAVSWTVIVTFVALTPVTLATSPSLPIDVLLHNLNVQEAGGNNPTLTTVSQGAYSIWPLITYFAHGTSGTLRAFTPSAEALVGSLTYQRAGQLLTLGGLLVVSTGLWLRKQATDTPGGYLPMVTLGIVSFLMFLTGIVSTHFLLALPLVIMCRQWMSREAYFFVVAAWSVTTLIPMFGDMGVALINHPGEFLSPVHNPVTKLVMDVYSWDRFITVGIVANICALILLASVALRRSSPLPAIA